MGYNHNTLYQAVIKAYRKNSDLARMTIVSACGTGKTRQAIGIFEARGASLTAVFVPTLSLISQTFAEWQKHAKQAFNALIICSDASVVDPGAAVISLDSREISSWMASPGNTPKVIFCTYQSSHIFKEVYHKYPKTPVIDLAIYDEAHFAAVNDEDSRYAITLNDDHVEIDQRVFMTATPKLFTSGGASSMDCEETFGETIFTYTNREAVADGIIKDFEIIVATVTDKQVSELVNSQKVVGTDHGNLKAHSAAVQIALCKAIEQFDLNTILGFYSSVQGAHQASVDFSLLAPNLKVKNIGAGAVDGQMSSTRINQALDRIKEGNFLLNSCRCIGVGTNIPTVDGLIFADPKTSLIEIVQNIGRGQRKTGPDDTTPLRVVIPMVVTDKLVISGFHKLLHILYQIREEDTVAIQKRGAQRRVVLTQGINDGVIRFLHCDTVLNREFIKSVELKIVSGSRTRWSYEACFEEASKYSNLNEWRDANFSSYMIASNNKWLDEIATKLNLRQRLKKGTITKEFCLNLANDFTDRAEFAARHPSVWKRMTKENWIPEHFTDAGRVDGSIKRGPPVIGKFFISKIQMYVNGEVSEKGAKSDRDFVTRALRHPERREWIAKNYPQLLINGGF